MARPITTGRSLETGPKPRPGKPTPFTIPQPLAFFRGFKGLNTREHASQLPREFARAVQNYTLERGRARVRQAVTAVGGISGAPLMHAFEYVTESGVAIPLRFTTRGLEQFDGGTWVPVMGLPVFTGGTLNFWAITSFGRKLVFSNGIDGLFEFDPTTGAGSTIATSASVPSAQQLTTFDNRVIATNTTDAAGHHATRVAWSTKNDETKWDGAVDIGAGAEDVTASPGTVVDRVQATLPVTDELAMIVRMRSIWLMSVTGFADAPFRFSLIFDELGSDSPYSLVRTPGGIVGFFRDNFYAVTPHGFRAFGDPIIDDLLPRLTGPREAFGAFDPFRNEYRCVLREDGAVWRFSFRDQGWTRDVYPFTPKTVAVTRYPAGGIFIDNLVGTIDALAGTIDELGTTGIAHGMYVTQDGAQPGYVTREVAGLGTDVDVAGQPLAVGTEIRTGLVVAETPLERVSIHEVQVEYEAFEAAEFVIEVSRTQGATWEAFGTCPVTATVGPAVTSCRRTVEGPTLMFRVRTTRLAAVTVLAVHAFVERGGLIKP